MLQIKYEEKKMPFKAGQEQFHIGAASDIRAFLSERKGEVTEIFADGHELAFILSRLNNIPHGHSSTTWRGEWAAFIAQNLIV